MRKIVYFIMVMIILTNCNRFIYAAKKNNSHSAELSSAVVLQTARDYVKDKLRKTPTFNIIDPVMKTTWEMYLVYFDKKVGKTGDKYYASAIFRDINTTWLLRVDFFVEQDAGGKPEVTDVEIREVAGKRRYTFDKDGNKISLTRSSKARK